MPDHVASFGLGLSIVVAIAVFVRVVLRRAVHTGHVLAALGCLVLYWAANMFASTALPWPASLATLQWNWQGKLTATVVTLLAIASYPRMRAAEVGLTTRQNPGSLGPSLLVAAAMCALSWTSEWLAADGANLQTETLLFQATMPGIDEELFFRGLLIASLARGFGTPWRLWRAPSGWGDVAAVLFFGAGHGLFVLDGRLHVKGSALAVTSLLGFGLLWIRRRTGSLLLPALVHNIVNLGSQLL